MSLTKHQQEKLDESLDILVNQKSNRLLIRGSAGVGKTYMVDMLLKELKGKIPSQKRIYCSAPTNKAVSVLKGKVQDDPRIDFITTHSALKLKRFINNKTGNVTFKPWFSDKYPPLKGVGLFIIDEASMLNESLLKFIEEFADRFNVKVIFIGDDKQLNPVGEEDSEVFKAGYPEVELTEVVRQGEGNPIIFLSRNLDEIQFRENNLVEEEDSEVGLGYLFTNNKYKAINELAAINGTDDLKYLAWTNNEVDQVNYMVRQTIYGTPNKIELGESLIFNSPYGEEYFTNEEIKVEDLGVATCLFKYICKNKKATREFEVKSIELKVYYINGKHEDKIPTGVLVIHEDSEHIYKEICRQLNNAAKFSDIEWKDYFSFAEKFADVKYNHAITVHKSQGSTYKQAIVNVSNLNLNKNSKERRRLMYTAITRASDTLILYNN